MAKPEFIDDIVYRDLSGRPAVVISFKNSLAPDQYGEIATIFKKYLEESSEGKFVIQPFLDGYCYKVKPKGARPFEGYEVSRLYIGRRRPRHEVAVIQGIHPFADRRILREFAKRLV